jgi:uncharacterized protein (TIGR02145 family)
LPTNDEWEQLFREVDGTSDKMSIPYGDFPSTTAGKYLKATRGWNNGGGNGEDTHGFSALPVGIGSSISYNDSTYFIFTVGGRGGFRWSSSERNNNKAYSWGISYLYDDALYLGEGDKNSSYISVRCIRGVLDQCGNLKYNTETQFCWGNDVFNKCGGLEYNPETQICKGTDILSNNYETIVIGTQTWMAENLNYVTRSSRCYNDDPANCEIYGRLYSWATAMNLPSNCNSNDCLDQIQPKHKGICPSGWHIPTREEYDVLSDFVGGRAIDAKHLKAKEGWDNCGPSGSGNYSLCEDTHNFAALPGGYFPSSYNYFTGIGRNGSWWSASEFSGSFASLMSMGSSESISWTGSSKKDLHSIRCIKD